MRRRHRERRPGRVGDGRPGGAGHEGGASHKGSAGGVSHKGGAGHKGSAGGVSHKGGAGHRGSAGGAGHKGGAGHRSSAGGAGHNGGAWALVMLAAASVMSCSRDGGGGEVAVPAPQEAHASVAASEDKAQGDRKQRLAAVKELTVNKLAPGVAIQIDGRLDEPAWRAAARTGPFVNVSTGRQDRSQPVQGEARLLWDDTFLYVGFDVSDRTITGGFPQGATDPHLWERDTVEVMIDPDGDGDNKDYYEIQINPQNLVFDSQFDDYNAPRGGASGPFGHEAWSAGLTSAVELRGTIDNDSDQDRGYVVEAKIPWASFTKAKSAPPSPGDTWRMNFYAMQNNGGVAWSPILGEGNFHRARRFGRVRFLGSGGETGGP